MKKLILIGLFIIVLCSFTFANEMTTNTTNLGHESAPVYSILNNAKSGVLIWTNWVLNNLPLDPTTKMVLSGKINEEIKTLQDQNAEGSTQLDDDEVLFRGQKMLLLDQADKGWALVKGLFKLLEETIILIMIVFEMRLILYFFIELVPRTLLSIRDSILNSIMRNIK
jgi:hypothetical protein